MVGDVVSMSLQERDRSYLVRLHAAGRIGQREAAERLDIGVRPFKRLVRAWKDAGDASLVSRRRGRPSNHRLSEETRTRIAALLEDRYAGYAATLAAEKLAELDGVRVGRETVRRLQIALSLWRPKKRRAGRVFQVRERRPGLASWCRSTAARTTGSRGGRRDAR